MTRPYVMFSLRHFRLALAFFIPWRVVAENPARRSSRAARCLLDLLGRRSGCWPQMVRSPAAPIPFWCYSGSGDAGAGRSERTTMRPLWRYGVDAANTPDRKPR